MYCPNCGSSQSEGKKFCTVCGTNLSLVSHALSGQSAQAPPPAVSPSIELERQREMSKGIRLTILGGGFFLWGFFKLLFSGFHEGPPSGVWSFIGFILLAIGISKLVSFRPTQTSAPSGNDHRILQAQPISPPRPVFSDFPPGEYVSPRTSELESARSTTPSVTEEETQQLPHGKSIRR